MKEDERRGTGRQAGTKTSRTVCHRLINPVLLRINGGKKSWKDHRMEKVEPRRGI